MAAVLELAVQRGISLSPGGEQKLLWETLALFLSLLSS